MVAIRAQNAHAPTSAKLKKLSGQRLADPFGPLVAVPSVHDPLAATVSR